MKPELLTSLENVFYSQTIQLRPGRADFEKNCACMHDITSGPTSMRFAFPEPYDINSFVPKLQMLYGIDQPNLNPEPPHPIPGRRKTSIFFSPLLKFSLKLSGSHNHTSFGDQSVTSWECRVSTLVVTFKSKGLERVVSPWKTSALPTSPVTDVTQRKGCFRGRNWDEGVWLKQ